MFSRFVLLATLIGALTVPTAISQNTNIKSCREHPQLVGSCFNVHGRLSVYNGAPALRILKIDTRRLLGVSEQRFAIEGYRNLPEEIRAKIDQDTLLYGDYLVCPFTKQRKHEMQLVCVEKVQNLVSKKR
ncbi:MAG TPA: hypothetical protein VGQ39_01715 [Pyrinomonadaceae bacterium]|jgi:hypothetical protein|nr:hypothetical protein [Pyrinomonadaceae bacterium]